MASVVLESFVGSAYDDTPTGYEFPARYRRVLEPLSRGETIQALIYEPRGRDGAGRMSYIGLAVLTEPPFEVARDRATGERRWRVNYVSTYKDFDRPVPREIGERPLEAWLAAVPHGRLRNSATRGQAVRAISDEDFVHILALGFVGDIQELLELRSNEYPTRDEHAAPVTLVAERARRLAEVVQRGALFRDRVLDTYERRCAITGFTVGPSSPIRIPVLVDAAHIRPVRHDGSDDISNGLALTPTLHRMFDAGLFTLRYSAGHLEVVTSPVLAEGMITSPDGRFQLLLDTGVRARLPTQPRSWPSPDQLRFHERNVYRAS